MKGEREFLETVGARVQSAARAFAPSHAKSHFIAEKDSTGFTKVFKDTARFPLNYTVTESYAEGSVVHSDGTYDWVHTHSDATTSYRGIPCRKEKITL